MTYFLIGLSIGFCLLSIILIFYSVNKTKELKGSTKQVQELKQEKEQDRNNLRLQKDNAVQKRSVEDEAKKTIQNINNNTLSCTDILSELATKSKNRIR